MTKASKATNINKQLNRDLGLDMGMGRRESSSAASQRTGDLSMEERKKIKEQLRDWRAKKVTEDK